MKKEVYILLLHKQLTGAITIEEEIALEKWRAEDESNDRYLRDIEATWNSAESYTPKVVASVEEAKKDFFNKVIGEKEKPPIYEINKNQPRTRSLFSYNWAIAASLILLVGAFFMFRQSLFNPLPDFMGPGSGLVQLDTDNFDNIQTLKDGSELWLNPGTVFRYDKDFNQEERLVYLHGEMFINVAKNLEKPFRIKMDHNEIRVLGTSFYIRSNDEDLVTLDVVEGHVQMSDQKGQIMDVKGGQSISYDKSTGKFVQSQDQSPPASDWRKGFLVFEDVPLTNVFGKLSIYFGVTFKIDCKRIDEMLGFNSRIQNDEENTLDSYLKKIQMVYKISIDKIDDKTYRVYGGPCK